MVSIPITQPICKTKQVTQSKITIMTANSATTKLSSPGLSPTPSQVEGPYFLADSPIRDSLIPAGLTGQAIEISGKILALDGSIIPAATLHVWLASPDGVYDNQDEQGNPLPIVTAEQKLRGRILTGASGAYKVNLLRPGNYEVAKGQFRPAHIHIRVEAPGYKTLITQLYFTDDPFNNSDLPGEGFFKPELLVPLKPGASSAEPQTGQFDFVLTKGV
jgi:protocatechuate 3,4-dioxygenase beta subunit